jgi:diguanylate cyclase (GGDEF)-like protein
MISTPPIRADAPIERVVDHFARYTDQTLCPVVDSAGAPVGMVAERTLHRFAGLLHGRDLMRGQAVRNFAIGCPHAELGSDLETGLEAFAAGEDAPCLIVTDGGRYAGFVMPGVLVTASVQRRLTDVSARNPLTGLPGHQRVQTALTDAAQDTASGHRYVCYFDFDSFKSFNDENGFRTGDRAITLFAETLRRLVPGDERNCAGHTGGDDFVVVLFGTEPDKTRALVMRVLREFSGIARDLHKEQDRRNGWYKTRDRNGERRRFPLLRASCAVIALGPEANLSETSHLDPMMARLKSMAKASRDGLSWFEAERDEDFVCFGRELDALAA